MTGHSLDRRPTGVSDDTVTAVGKLEEACEWMERARGHLYSFHQMTGRVDLLLGEAVELLESAGHDESAEEIRHEIIGRNVLKGRWSFQVVEEYDECFWTPVHQVVAQIRQDLVGGVRHIHEAEMKAARITAGHPDHLPQPGD